MDEPLPCLRRAEPSAALIPRLGQSQFAYVPATRTDIRKRIHEFNLDFKRKVRRCLSCVPSYDGISKGPWCVGD